MTPERSKLAARLWKSMVSLTGAALLLASGCCGSGTSGGLGDLMPGHKDADLRSRVEHDSFPTADQALHSPAPADGKQQ